MHNFTSSFIRHSNGSIIFRSIEIYIKNIRKNSTVLRRKMGISIGLGRAFLCKQISCADAHFPITSKLQSSNNSFILITLAFIGYGTNVRDKT